MRSAVAVPWALASMLALHSAAAQTFWFVPTEPTQSASAMTEPQMPAPTKDAAQENAADAQGKDVDEASETKKQGDCSDQAFPCCCCKRSEPQHTCDKCPRVNNLNPAWGVTLGGTVSLDAFYNSARPVAPGTPFLLTPRGPFADDTFDIHARESTFYLAGKGPKIGAFETGGLVMFALYNDSITIDKYGFLPFQAFGELKNENCRFAGGLQLDIFAPLIPTVLPFSILAASGNTGIYRGQLRGERFFYPGKDSQITLTAGISDANPTLLVSDVLTEDNGWPNVEARIGWASGPLKQEGLVSRRPFEFGVSAVVGQVRSTELGPLNRVVADVWGVAEDYRWQFSETWGFQGEVFTGQGLGTYGGGALQNINTATFEAIRATGGWAELYHYLTPCLHAHLGYGIDDPLDADLAPSQVARNDTIFANLIWDVTPSLRLSNELTYRTTDYLTLPDNDGVGVQWQMQWKF